MDNLSADQRQKAIASVRGRDTRAELIVRRMLHFMGLRLRLHRRDLPGRPDITLVSGSAWCPTLGSYGSISMI